jgi:glucosyl-dolichyl phosphate glucuronosyltransferase
MELTAAICTYQRFDLLKTTLQSLAACDEIDAQWELIVVDNDPANTNGEADENKMQQLVESFRDELPIRYIVESNAGTSHARNRAVREAIAPVIVFTDDDVTFESAWLKQMWQAIQSRPDCAFWGGRVEPVWTTPKPSWFDPSHFALLGDTIVQYDQGDAPRMWRKDIDPPFYTANLAFEIAAIDQQGGFDTTVGHRGDVRMGMEDSLMVKGIASAGRCGWYAADAKVFHPVPIERTKPEFAKAFTWRQGWLSAEMTRQRADDNFGGPGKLPKWYYRVAITEYLAGFCKTVVGLCTFQVAKRFAGRLQMRFNLSRLWHALKTKGGAHA